MPEGWITVDEAALILGIGPRRVRQLIEGGRLPAQMFAGSWAIRLADLERVRVRKPGRPAKKKPVRRKR